MFLITGQKEPLLRKINEKAAQKCAAAHHPPAPSATILPLPGRSISLSDDVRLNQG